MRTSRKTFYIFSFICYMVLFSGLWLVDISVSAQFILLSGFSGQLQGLLFVGVEPRVLYHIGLMMITLAFVVMSVLFLNAMERR